MVKIVFATGNSAFDDDDPRPEIARILRFVTTRIWAGDREGKLQDANGNEIGFFLVTPAHADQE